ncbi:tetratricopeptide repeat protein [Denitromonas ohlonensis]|nr:tetratricopeptide repeat protein [Denitromonas ohlonensis]
MNARLSENQEYLRDLEKKARRGDDQAIAIIAEHAETPGALQAEAIFHLALMHDETGEPSPFDVDRVAAKGLYQVAAEMGHSMAGYFLGNMLDYGEGGERNPEQARRWYGFAAAEGIRDAQMHYARMLEMGRGGHRDLEEAAQWYEKAVMQGDELAAMNLGLLHLNGQLNSSNEEVAVRLFRFAADSLLASAHIQLGELHWEGRILEENHQYALLHFCIAVELEPEEPWRSEALKRQQKFFAALDDTARQEFTETARKYVAETHCDSRGSLSRQTLN